MCNNQEILDFFLKQDIKIDLKSYKNCSNLTKVKIPKYIKKIGVNTFNNCTSLTEVVFEEPSSLLFISSYAFQNCKSLKKITIPSKVLMIGKHAFTKCQSLTEITVSSNTRIIDELSYDSLNIKRIQSQPLENEYEKALQKFVSILKLPETDIKDCIDADDTILDHIVDAFKKFPCLFNEDQDAINAKLSELGLDDEIKKYFSGFYYTTITLYVRQSFSGRTFEYTYKEDDEVEILYKEMYDKFYDGVNKITLYRPEYGHERLEKILPRKRTFKENKVENHEKMVFMTTLLGG